MSSRQWGAPPSIGHWRQPRPLFKERVPPADAPAARGLANARAMRPRANYAGRPRASTWHRTPTAHRPVQRGRGGLANQLRQHQHHRQQQRHQWSRGPSTSYRHGDEYDQHGRYGHGQGIVSLMDYQWASSSTDYHADWQQYTNASSEYHNADQFYERAQYPPERQESTEKQSGGENEFVLLYRTNVTNAIAMLNQSIGFSGVKLEFVESAAELGRRSAMVKLNGRAVKESRCTAASAKVAKHAAAECAIRLLAKRYPLVQITMSAGAGTGGAAGQPDVQLEDLLYNMQMEKAKEAVGGISDAAMRMMAKMGWKPGDGLGKSGQGVSEPVTVREVFMRQGLGFSESDAFDHRAFQRAVDKLCSELAARPTTAGQLPSITLSADLTKEQRVVVHVTAKKYRLKSTSHGVDGRDRRLTITKRLAATDLVGLLQSFAGGKCGRYTLYAPALWRPMEHLESVAAANTQWENVGGLAEALARYKPEDDDSFDAEPDVIVYGDGDEHNVMEHSGQVGGGGDAATASRVDAIGGSDTREAVANDVHEREDESRAGFGFGAGGKQFGMVSASYALPP